MTSLKCILHTILALSQSRSHTLFYLIISSDNSNINILVNKNVYVNNENYQYNNCGSEINLYIRQEESISIEIIIFFRRLHTRFLYTTSRLDGAYYVYDSCR